MKDRIMRDEDKPFVIYRRGSLNFTIVPRGVKGWTQFAVWMVLLVPLLVWFTQYAETHESGLQFAIGMALFFAGMLVWTLGGIWWMRARAEVVDVEELLKLKREQERKRRGGR
jgi:hypothetical protein